MKIIVLSRNEGLYSTNSIVQSARLRGHEIEVVDHMNCDLWIEKGKLSIFYFDEPILHTDFIIPRIGASVTNRGASVIQQFALMGVKSTLSQSALVQSRDKLRCLQILAANNIDVPKSIMSTDIESIRFLHDQLGSIRSVIKLLISTQGMGVLLSENKVSAIAIAETFQKLGKDFIIQEYIEESKGTDIRVLIVDDHIIAAMERRAGGEEFRSNLHLGGTSRPINLTKEEKVLALKSTKLMGLKIAGVDILRSHRGPLVIEVNASPGLEGIETTTGIDVAEAIIKMIERQHRS